MIPRGKSPNPQSSPSWWCIADGGGLGLGLGLEEGGEEEEEEEEGREELVL